MPKATGTTIEQLSTASLAGGDAASTSALAPTPFPPRMMSLAAIAASAALVVPLLLLQALPKAAIAATAAEAPNTAAVLPNALVVAYGHYFFMLIAMGALTFERATVQANMSTETKKLLVMADVIHVLNGVLMFATGYARVMEFGKGWDFYSHEPFLWLKMASLGLLAGLSLFPTITLVQRGSKIFQDELIDPISEKLAAHMQSIWNAEILALLTIPLLATLMARGVGYNDGFPWQAGAASTGLTLLGSGFFYAKQALSLTEDNRKMIESSSLEQQECKAPTTVF